VQTEYPTKYYTESYNKKDENWAFRESISLNETWDEVQFGKYALWFIMSVQK
jgi:hypothetical protein